MSVQTLYTAATGMEALETRLDVVANNLANINTTGFKRDRANFEDLMYRHHVLPGTVDAQGNPTAVGTKIGLGVKVSSVQSDFGQGAFEPTQRALDIAIEGSGFLPVTDTSGDTVYTRAGNLNINATGDLVLGSASAGRLLNPPINIPPTATGIEISANGEVRYREEGTQGLTKAGDIQLANFINPEGLLKLGENLYAVTDASGQATLGTPNQDGFGALVQGTLETSNVQPVKELIDLITTQRSFELNSQAVQAGDSIMQQIANLRRF